MTTGLHSSQTRFARLATAANEYAESISRNLPTPDELLREVAGEVEPARSPDILQTARPTYSLQIQTG